MNEFYQEYSTSALLYSYYKEELKSKLAEIENNGRKNNETKLEIFKKCLNATMELNNKFFK